MDSDVREYSVVNPFIEYHILLQQKVMNILIFKHLIALMINMSNDGQNRGIQNNINQSRNQSNSSLSESNTYNLARILIVGYFVLIFYAVIADNQNYDLFKLVTSSVGTIAAAVVGYYFGNKPVSKAIDDAENNKKIAVTTNLDRINELEQGKQVYDQINSELQSIKHDLQGMVTPPTPSQISKVDSLITKVDNRKTIVAELQNYRRAQIY